MTSLMNSQPLIGGRRLEPAGLPTPPSGLRVMGLLARTTWRRLSNRGAALFARKKTADQAAGPRQATPGKQKLPVWLFLLRLYLVLAAVGGSAVLTFSFVERMSDRVSPKLPPTAADQPTDPSSPVSDANGPSASEKARQAGEDPPKASADGPVWPQPPDDQLLASVVGLFLLLLTLSCLILQMGANQDLGKVEWDMEWLFTFPVSARTLLLARLVQYATVGQFTLMFWLWAVPGFTVLYACAGHGWWSFPLALATTAYLVAVIASACLVVEIWVQKRLAAGNRKNLQAVLGVLGCLLVFPCMAAIIKDTFDPLTVNLVRGLPAAVWANPFSLPAWLCVGGWQPVAAGSAMALLGVAVPFGAVRLAGRLVRDGLVVAPGAHQGSRGTRTTLAKTGGWFRGVVGKELRLLMRDRAFLVQTLVTPALLAGFYFLLYWQTGTQLIQDPRHAAAMAFGVGTYVLLFSAFHVLATEGGAVWLLYTFPRKLHAVLLQKTFLWCGVAALYALAILGVAALAGMPLSGEVVVAGVFAVVGLVLYAFIAAALGILACNPLEAVVQRRIRPDAMYFFMALAASYAAALYAPSNWGMVVQVVLSGLVAFAFWQKVQDRVPYLLEPTASAPPSVSLADGLIAVQAYLTVQTLTWIFVKEVAGDQLPMSAQILIATGVAGTVVGLAALFYLRKVPGVLALTGLTTAATDPRPALRQVLAPGVVAGVLAGLFGVAYMMVVGQIEALRSWKEALTSVPSPLKDPVFFAWGLLAAPLFEEFLFRGLVYRGIRKSLRPVYAVVGSAALFAVAHPSFKVIPVFVLGVATALSFQRSRLLWTSILTHVVYNAIVVVAAWMM